MAITTQFLDPYRRYAMQTTGGATSERNHFRLRPRAKRMNDTTHFAENCMLNEPGPNMFSDGAAPRSHLEHLKQKVR